MKKKTALIVLLFLSIGLHAQWERSDKDDIKVGLVLSGGGAKGFAHVGVIKVLEEAGIRVDFVGGTSMGAIIGSLYASGYSSKDIDSIIRSVDFEKIMLDEIPRRAKPFYEKQSGENHVLVLPIKKKKIELPKAISKGQNVLNLLTELLDHVDTVSDFNKLPIPFVCIATDIETGEPVVIRDGFLPTAVQASGAFPTLLEPVERDGRLLIDGGVVNNFPVNEVKKMGADVIIGVSLSNNFDKKEDLNSILKIINQIVNFQVYSNYEDQVKSTDVHLNPDMRGYDVTSFDKYDTIFNLGEAIARTRMQDLLEIAEAQKEKRPPFELTKRQKEFNISAIDIEGNLDYTNKYVMAKMKLEVGKTISYSDILDGINQLSATGNFTNIQYKLIEEEKGVRVELKLKQNEIPTHAKFAIHYDDLYKSAVLANITTKHALTKNDVISADLILGDNIRYNFDYFIDNGSNWSFGLNSRYNTFKADVQVDWIPSVVNKIDLKYRDFTNQIYFQSVINRSFAVGIGAEHKNIRAYTETFVPSTTSNEDEDRNYFDKSNYYNFISYLKLDTYDKKYFQKSGLNLDIDFRWYLFSNDYNNNFESFSQLKGKFGYAHTFFDKLTLHFITEAGVTIGNNENEILDYHLGGLGENYINTFLPFYGYEFATLSDSGFLLSTIETRYELFKNNYLLGAASVARVEDDLLNEGRIFENTKVGFNLGYGVDSIIGPVELNLTYSPDTDESFWYFNLGYWF
ncbi:patatin-like phospholipase family protein [Urechidicola vernalis]|uniref:Patatin-like phospholipase family protein n=1 Tax=Urechidicola vernalis TaxID=3075600 RepID=A0ABU2YA84_9FLAO|nr:patatin-like phospholipase family protein [Urechidicola sp. P050]MDT0553978.1 patatin-like phospholipase family protein [Urechidicola sp. P050]